MRRVFALLLVLLASMLAGCISSGQSVGGFVPAPTTVKQPDFLNSEIAAYAPRIYSVLSGYGFKVGYTDDPNALRLEINFDPNIMSTTVSIKLLKPGAGVIASAEAVNHGWGTLIARNQAIGNLVESAADKFSQQLSDIHFTLTSDRNNYQSCFNDLASDPDLAGIREKVALAKVQDQTFSMLADNSKPTDQEKPILKRWGNKRDACMKMRRESMATQHVPLAITNVLDATDTASQSLIVDLLNGNLTFADYARKRRDLTTFANESIAQIDMELRKQTEESRFKANQLAIEAQRNVLTQQKIISDRDMQQQQINAQRLNNVNSNRATSTNCFVAGSNITCNSW